MAPPIEIRGFPIGLYHALGVPEEATQNEIKRCYRAMAKAWHPDKNSERDTTEKFQKLSEAFGILLNPVTRKKYDEQMRDFNANRSNKKVKYIECPNGVENVIDGCTVCVNKQSVTIKTDCPIEEWIRACETMYTTKGNDRGNHGVQYKVPYVSENEEGNFGYISVTVYSTTSTILVQGNSAFLWMEEHLPKLRHMIANKVLSLKPEADIQNGGDHDATILHATNPAPRLAKIKAAEAITKNTKQTRSQPANAIQVDTISEVFGSIQLSANEATDTIALDLPPKASTHEDAGGLEERSATNIPPTATTAPPTLEALASAVIRQQNANKDSSHCKQHHKQAAVDGAYSSLEHIVHRLDEKYVNVVKMLGAIKRDCSFHTITHAAHIKTLLNRCMNLEKDNASLKVQIVNLKTNKENVTEGKQSPSKTNLKLQTTPCVEMGTPCITENQTAVIENVDVSGDDDDREDVIYVPTIPVHNRYESFNIDETTTTPYTIKDMGKNTKTRDPAVAKRKHVNKTSKSTNIQPPINTKSPKTAPISTHKGITTSLKPDIVIIKDHPGFTIEGSKMYTKTSCKVYSLRGSREVPEARNLIEKLKSTPRVVIFMLGSNDIARRRVDEIKTQINYLIQQTRSKWSKVDIYLTTAIPEFVDLDPRTSFDSVAAYNNMLYTLSNEIGFKVIDITAASGNQDLFTRVNGCTSFIEGGVRYIVKIIKNNISSSIYKSKNEYSSLTHNSSDGLWRGPLADNFPKLPSPAAGNIQRNHVAVDQWPAATRNHTTYWQQSQAPPIVSDPQKEPRWQPTHEPGPAQENAPPGGFATALLALMSTFGIQ